MLNDLAGLLSVIVSQMLLRNTCKERGHCNSLVVERPEVFFLEQNAESTSCEA